MCFRTLWMTIPCIIDSVQSCYSLRHFFIDGNIGRLDLLLDMRGIKVLVSVETACTSYYWGGCQRCCPMYVVWYFCGCWAIFGPVLFSYIITGSCCLIKANHFQLYAEMGLTLHCPNLKFRISRLCLFDLFSWLSHWMIALLV